MENLVALEHYNSNPRIVKVDGCVYNFFPKFNVSLAFVKPEHVEKLLAMQVRICCGKTKPLCHLASETNINIWKTGNRYGF